VKTDIPSQHADSAAPSWWPLDCLRSLGRAASIASGADSRGFRSAAAPGPAAVRKP